MLQVRRFRSPAGWLLAVSLLLAAGRAAAGGGVLRSVLDRPAVPPPSWLLAGPTLGGSPDWDPLTLGAAAEILLPPGAAAALFPPCWDWDCGLVLGGEYRDVAADRNLVVLDLTLRRYVVPPDRAGGRAVLFAGLGAGIALAGYPAGGGTATDSTGAAVVLPSHHAEERWFTASMELGYQWHLHPRVLAVAAIRWRNYIHRPRDYSGWSCRFLLGIPTPW